MKKGKVLKVLGIVYYSVLGVILAATSFFTVSYAFEFTFAKNFAKYLRRVFNVSFFDFVQNGLIVIVVVSIIMIVSLVLSDEKSIHKKLSKTKR